MITKRSNLEKQNIFRGENRILLIITCAVFLILISIILVMNLRFPITFTIYNSNTISYEKGKVTAVLDEQLEDAPGMPGWQLGSQVITVRMKEGPQKGQEIQLDNNLSTGHNIRVKPGQSVIVKADRPEDITPFYTIYNYDRTVGLIYVIVIFVVFMFAVGWFKGLRSVLGIGISLFFILGFLLPVIYHGYSPVLMALITVIVIAVFSFLLLNGFSLKTLTALTATIVGALLSVGFFFLISGLLKLSGYNIDDAEGLILISRSTGLQINQVLFVGVLIASLGAVMDVTISIASSLYEIKKIQPGLPKRELFRSGISVGRDMIGTMCQTLILAFTGSALSTLLVMISYGTQFNQFINSDYIAIEVIHGITGSLAVISAVPITAGLCVFFSGSLKKINFL